MIGCFCASSTISFVTCRKTYLTLGALATATRLAMETADSSLRVRPSTSSMQASFMSRSSISRCSSFAADQISQLPYVSIHLSEKRFSSAKHTLIDSMF
eukprot:3150104-Rhodomonas_salina.1